MILRTRSFPHPVLTPFTDDVQPSEFKIELSVDHDPDNYYLKLKFLYENVTLANLLRDKHAAHTVHLECRRNFFRRSFSSTDREFSLTIPSKELVGRIEISGFITASAEISEYQIEGSHDDYDEAIFSIRPGDILAAAPSLKFDAYVDYDPLKKISSILTVSCNKESTDGPMTVDTSGDRIIATLAKHDFERYTDLKADPSIGPLLANQIVIPALLEALHEIANTDEEEMDVEMDRRWFRSIVEKLRNEGIDLSLPETTPLEALQTILRLPLRRTLDGLRSINALDDSE